MVLSSLSMATPSPSGELQSPPAYRGASSRPDILADELGAPGGRHLRDGGLLEVIVRQAERLGGEGIGVFAVPAEPDPRDGLLLDPDPRREQLVLPPGEIAGDPLPMQFG